MKSLDTSKYYVSTRCTNCRHNQSVCLPKGITIEVGLRAVPCENCGCDCLEVCIENDWVWMDSGPKLNNNDSITQDPNKLLCSTDARGINVTD